MKKVFSEKTLALVLVLLALGATYYFYKQEEISFLPSRGEKKEIEIATAEVFISEKEIRLSYGDKQEVAFDIANFENNENWFGDGDFDFSTYFEGEASLFLSSFNNQKASVSLRKNFDIEDVLNFKFLIHLATDPTYIQELNLTFTGADSQYKFPIRDINKGWNLLLLPQDKFSRISVEGKEGCEVEEVAIELVSRPQTRSTVNLDSLWVEKENSYLGDWNADSDRFLSLKEGPEKAGLLAAGLFGSRAVFNRGSAKDFTVQAKFVPTKEGNFGFFLRGDYKSGYGYYLMMGGAETDSWWIRKNGLFGEKNQVEDLTKGEISNFKMEKNKTYWLKAELKGQNLVFYFSSDGRSFTKLGETKDESFASGGVGFAVFGGMIFIDDFQFFQN